MAAPQLQARVPNEVFRRVTQLAREVDKKTSEWVRDAIMEKLGREEMTGAIVRIESRLLGELGGVEARIKEHITSEIDDLTIQD